MILMETGTEMTSHISTRIKKVQRDMGPQLALRCTHHYREEQWVVVFGSNTEQLIQIFNVFPQFPQENSGILP
jgi:hypothetical protein